jgi:hypothetical protein
MPGNNMKQPRGAQISKAGNRKPVPDCDLEYLEDVLVGYVKKVGNEQAWQLYSYNTLLVTQAANGKDLWRTLPLLQCLVQVAPWAEIKYADLKPSSIISCEIVMFVLAKLNFQLA